MGERREREREKLATRDHFPTEREKREREREKASSFSLSLSRRASSLVSVSQSFPQFGRQLFPLDRKRSHQSLCVFVSWTSGSVTPSGGSLAVHDAVLDVFSDVEAVDLGSWRVDPQRGEAQGPEGIVRVRKGKKQRTGINIETVVTSLASFCCPIL